MPQNDQCQEAKMFAIKLYKMNFVDTGHLINATKNYSISYALHARKLWSVQQIHRDVQKQKRNSNISDYHGNKANKNKRST